MNNTSKNIVDTTDDILTKKIELSKQELETIFDVIDEMICIVDSNLVIVRVNKVYADFVGMTIKDLLGKKCFRTLWDCEEMCEACPCLETFRSGRVVTQKQVIRKSTGEIKYFNIRTFPVTDESGEIIHVIEFIKDVTDEKHMIEQLIRSEKLASIGVMTAGIAHEMNNPLSGISGTAANLLEKPEKYGLNEKGISRINAILESAARATVIMKDLLHLSKKNDSIHVLVDINKLLIKTTNAVHVVGAGDVPKQFRLDQSIPLVLCDPSKIDQVIFNVVTNAMQSIVEKSRTLSASGKKFTGNLHVATQNLNESVLITITDNGVGIPPEIRSKIFDPFFSTKSAGQGTGLGLSVCHRIVEEHQGRIFFETVNNLTTFSIELPVKPVAAKQQ